jgi:hypothetical protein
VVEAWPELPQAIRAGIVAMVEAASKTRIWEFFALPSLAVPTRITGKSSAFRVWATRDTIL